MGCEFGDVVVVFLCLSVVKFHTERIILNRISVPTVRIQRINILKDLVQNLQENHGSFRILLLYIFLTYHITKINLDSRKGVVSSALWGNGMCVH